MPGSFLHTKKIHSRVIYVCIYIRFHRSKNDLYAKFIVMTTDIQKFDQNSKPACSNMTQLEHKFITENNVLD